MTEILPLIKSNQQACPNLNLRVKRFYDLCVNKELTNMLKNCLASLINHQPTLSLFLAERLASLCDNDPISSFILSECYY